MNIDNLTIATIRFANFIAVRIIFFAVSIYLVAITGNIELEDLNEKGGPILQTLAGSSEAINAFVSSWSVGSVAVYGSFFVFVTIVHVYYEFARIVGSYLPLHIIFANDDEAENRMQRTVVRALRKKGVGIDERRAVKKSIDGVSKDIRASTYLSRSDGAAYFNILKYSCFALPILVIRVGNAHGWFVFWVEMALILAAILTGLRLIALERAIRNQILLEVKDRVIRETDLEQPPALRENFSYELDWIIPPMDWSMRKKAALLFGKTQEALQALGRRRYE